MENNCGFPIDVVQGADFSWPVYWQDSNGDAINLNGYTAEMQIRRTRGSTGDPLVDCDIAITANMGLMLITIPNVDTAELEAPTKAVYDLFVTVNSLKTRILWGEVNIIERVTK